VTDRRTDGRTDRQSYDALAYARVAKIYFKNFLPLESENVINADLYSNPHTDPNPSQIAQHILQIAQIYKVRAT